MKPTFAKLASRKVHFRLFNSRLHDNTRRVIEVGWREEIDAETLKKLACAAAALNKPANQKR